MNKRTTGALAALAVTVAGVVSGVVPTPGVHADSTAPWQAAGLKSPNATGTIALLGPTGTPVTSGSIDAPLASYAVAQGSTLRAGDTVASLAVVTPLAKVGASTQLAKDSNTDPTYASWKASAANGPDSWTALTIAAPTTQTGLPAFATGPTVRLADSVTLRQYLAGYANALTADGYSNVYELRLSTGAPGRAFDPKYAVLDIEVNGDQWHLYGEGGPQAAATSTTLQAAPSTAEVGKPVTLTATVSPAVAGSVRFKAGTTDLGSVAVDGSGRATTTWTPGSAGAVQLTSSFTPTDTTAYKTSSKVITYTVSAAKATVTPTWPTFRYGAASTVHVVVASTPAPTGTVSIVYAGRVIASATLSGGRADVKVPATALPAGARALVARFTSSATTKVASKDSTAKTVNVAKAVSKVANTTVPKKVKRTKKTTFVFTVTAPGVTPTGTVKVYDGRKVVATVALAGGKATVKLKLKKGKHSLKAAYLGNANVAASTGAVVKVTSK